MFVFENGFLFTLWMQYLNFLNFLIVQVGCVEPDPERYPLFAAFPSMREHVYLKEICDLPTPVRPAFNNCDLGVKPNQKTIKVYLKCDCKTSVVYGGNKPRKLVGQNHSVQ